MASSLPVDGRTVGLAPLRPGLGRSPAYGAPRGAELARPAVPPGRLPLLRDGPTTRATHHQGHHQGHHQAHHQGPPPGGQGHRGAQGGTGGRGTGAPGTGSACAPMRVGTHVLCGHRARHTHAWQGYRCMPIVGMGIGHTHSGHGYMHIHVVRLSYGHIPIHRMGM